MTDALSYFSAKLAHETDASDVYAAQKAGEQFVLVDVRGDEAWAQGRISGAIHLPSPGHRRAGTARARPGASRWSSTAGAPAATPARRARSNSRSSATRVKEMIGGYEYWVREGQPTENDEGALPRTFDAQVMVVRAAGRRLSATPSRALRRTGRPRRRRTSARSTSDDVGASYSTSHTTAVDVVPRPGLERERDERGAAAAGDAAAASTRSQLVSGR